MDPEFVVIFDFDWSLINENSDTWVIKEICPQLEEYTRDLVKKQSDDFGKGKWTQLMDHMILKMQVEHNVSIERIIESLQSIPIFEENILLIKKLKELNIPMAIVSDANVFYIDVILKHIGFESDFCKIITNFSPIEDGKLRIKPYQDLNEPHECKKCPANLCKSVALGHLMSHSAAMLDKNIIYIGDGGGDLCPSLRLLTQKLDNPRNQHHICCRKDWTLHKKLIEYISNGSISTHKEYIYAWDDGLDLYNIIINTIIKCDENR